MKSRLYHDVAHLQPLSKVPTTSYTYITKVPRARSNHRNTMTYQISNSYTLWLQRYNPDKIFKVKVTRTRSKVKSRSHQDCLHIQPLTNVSSKCQPSTHHTFEINQTGVWMSRLQQSQSSNRSLTLLFHTYNS